MMMRKLLVFVISISAGFPALAETPRQQADRICHAYIDDRQAFVEAETTDCEVKVPGSKYAQKTKCALYHDRQSGKYQKLASVFSSGTCSSNTIQKISDTNEIMPGDYAISNVYSDHYKWGNSEEFLSYKNQLLITNGNDLRLPKEDSQVMLCRFSYQLDGWEKPEPENNSVCQKFAARDYTSGGRTLEPSEVVELPKIREAKAETVYHEDLDNDGTIEEIVAYFQASGAGCGCDRPFLEIISGSKKMLGSNPAATKTSENLIKMTESLNSLNPGCERASYPISIVKIEEKPYILIDYIPYVTDKIVLSKEIPSRELYEFRGMHFEKICSQKAKSKQVILHEVWDEKSELRRGYKPVE